MRHLRSPLSARQKCNFSHSDQRDLLFLQQTDGYIQWVYTLNFHEVIKGCFWWGGFWIRLWVRKRKISSITLCKKKKRCKTFFSSVIMDWRVVTSMNWVLLPSFQFLLIQLYKPLSSLSFLHTDEAGHKFSGHYLRRMFLSAFLSLESPMPSH